MGSDQFVLFADPARLWHQGRLPTAAHLADRRLSGGDPHGHGVPQRLHHQGRRLWPGPSLSRHRDACLRRRDHDHVPHFLRGHRKRSQARAVLQPDQPVGLHGHRDRHRHRTSGQRRRLPRFRPYRLQGAAVHVHGGGTVPNRQDQRLGPGRALQEHAVDHGVLHHWRRFYFGIPAFFGIRRQVHGADGGPRGGL